jgi:DNA-binding NarL/FixJ family response regulator
MRILLAVNPLVTRTALRMFLQEEPGMQIVSEVNRVGELMREVQITHPDLVIMDWNLSGISPYDHRISAAGTLTRRPNQLKAVVISSLHHITPNPFILVLCSQPEDSIPALFAGADAFIYQGDSPKLLINLLRTIEGSINPQN